MLNQSKLPELQRRLDNGEPLTIICKELELSRNSVYVYYKKHDQPLRSKYIYKPFKLTDDLRKEISEKYKNGATTTQLGKEYNVGHKTIARCVLEFNQSIRSINDNRQLNGHPIINAVMMSYKLSKAATKYGFNLTYDDVSKLIQSNCNYCNIRPIQHRKNKKSTEELKYNGIDRLDCTKGYSIDNVVACCKWCNFAKNTMTLQEFDKWLIAIIAYRFKHKFSTILPNIDIIELLN